MLIEIPASRHSHSSHETCEYHKKHPDENYAGCTCSSSLWNCDMTKCMPNSSKLKMILAKARKIIELDFP